MIGTFVLMVTIVLIVGYRWYGRFLSRRVGLDERRKTPAHRLCDGVDFVPAKGSLLLGQHFSAIAAAGPIVGPVLACIWFGWVPALVWIVLGAIFIGGTHDFLSLIASVRHDGASIGEIVRRYMSPRAHALFLLFIWLALLYVITAFTDITAHTFKSLVAGVPYGPGVAASSVLYLAAAVAMGLLLYRGRLSLGIATAIFVPVVLLIVWIGPRLPHAVLAPFAALSVKQWDLVLLLYCLGASLVPVWLLLQPRGYLGGWFLYLVIGIGFVGALGGGFKIMYPAFALDGLHSALNGKALVPLLFITIACGACSGFHGIVSSGTTSKQLASENDALPVGYGAMLLEALVAVLAMATVMMLPRTEAILREDPNLIYAAGISRYLGLLGIGAQVALPFALLAFSTFVYDTLDVCTRLARYVLQELTGVRSRAGAVAAALISLALPCGFLMMTKEKGYLVAWPLFGTTNQLLASLILLALSVWLIRTGRRAFYTLIPMCFMGVVTLWSLGTLILPLVRGLRRAMLPSSDVMISGGCGIVLLLLSVLLMGESAAVITRAWRQQKESIR